MSMYVCMHIHVLDHLIVDVGAHVERRVRTVEYVRVRVAALICVAVVQAPRAEAARTVWAQQRIALVEVRLQHERRAAAPANTRTVRRAYISS